MNEVQALMKEADLRKRALKKIAADATKKALENLRNKKKKDAPPADEGE